MKIEFYVHQIWLALICVLMIVSLIYPIASFAVDGGEVIRLTNFRLLYEDGSAKGALWGLGVLLIINLGVAVFELLLSGFRNFVLQKRLIIFMMLLTVGYYLVLVLYILLLKGSASFIPGIPVAFPLVCLVLEYMSIHGVSKAEAEILARANGFRLRD
ncbi:MAG: DUF4293 family protein [Bacteroidaceae bacterium]|nr:DUF4293 family protein [Bacteroidaceae bacterium]